MADFVFNVAKGRVAEFHNRVVNNDPANSALVVVILATTGLEGDALLKDHATLSALLATSTNEPTNTGYARKVLTNTDLSAIVVDNTNDRVDLELDPQTWTAVAAGSGWSKLLVCYDSDTTGGSDANIIPLTAHDFVLTPDGSDIVATIAGDGYYRAS